MTTMATFPELKPTLGPDITLTTQASASLFTLASILEAPVVKVVWHIFLVSIVKLLIEYFFDVFINDIRFLICKCNAIFDDTADILQFIGYVLTWRIIYFFYR